MSSLRICAPKVFCTARPAPFRHASMRHPAAGDEAVIRLLDLIAVLRVVEVVREVREQIEVVAGEVSGDARGRVAIAARALPVSDQAVAIRMTAVRRSRSTRIDRSARTE